MLILINPVNREYSFYVIFINTDDREFSLDANIYKIQPTGSVLLILIFINPANRECSFGANIYKSSQPGLLF